MQITKSRLKEIIKEELLRVNENYGYEQVEQRQVLDLEQALDLAFQLEQHILPDDSIKPNWLAIPLQSEYRYDLLHFLEENNVQTRVTFAGNVTRHPAYRNYLKPFKNSDIIMRNGFLLGAHHGMNVDDVDYVTDKIIKFFN